jgi:hypothetical protein
MVEEKRLRCRTKHRATEKEEGGVYDLERNMVGII